MTLHLTPTMLRAAYSLIASSVPFTIRSWRVPPADEVEFHVTRNPNVEGTYECKNGTHSLEISDRCIGTSAHLLEVIAHEMIHLAQQVHKQTTPNTEHNSDFRRRWADVAAIHGFDPKTL